MGRRQGGRTNVEPGVDDGGHGLDLGPELLLDAVQVEAVLVREKIDGDTEVTESARATDAMQVRLGRLGEVLQSRARVRHEEREQAGRGWQRTKLMTTFTA